MERLCSLVTKMTRSIPAAIASSMAYWIAGRSTIGRSSFGTAFVAGRKRVPQPATGKTAVRMFMSASVWASRWGWISG